MAMNPMQRKANNYLLIGVFVTLLITGSIIAFLIFQMTKLQKQIKDEEATRISVYVTNKNIKSGETIDLNSLTKKDVSSSVVSANTTKLNITEETISKINISAGTIVTTDMLVESSEKTTNDLRRQEYNMVILPTQIETGDYVDIRLRLSNGVDFIVASKKKVEIPELGDASATVVKLNMNEAETLVMSNAIIEAYIDEGSLLYATTYVEPGLQTSVIPTYVPSGTVQSILNSNPNIEQEAKNALFSRYNANTASRTSIIEGTLSQYAQDRVDNIEAGVQEEITRAKEARQTYLESLGGY